jgi:hypothetical protein
MFQVTVLHKWSIPTCKPKLRACFIVIEYLYLLQNTVIQITYSALRTVVLHIWRNFNISLQYICLFLTCCFGLFTYFKIAYVLSTGYNLRNQNSSVSILMGYSLDVWGSIPGGARDFSLLHSIQTGSRAHPASYPMDTRDSFHGVKRLRREADHSPSI